MPKIAVIPDNRTDGIRSLLILVTDNPRYHGKPAIFFDDPEECVVRLRAWLARAVEDKHGA